MEVPAPQKLAPKWQSAVLVCKDCRKRRDGPEGVRPKELAKRAKAVAKDSGAKARVAMTSCLGLCPKRAVAVACVKEGGAISAFAIEAGRELAALLPILRAGADRAARD